MQKLLFINTFFEEELSASSSSLSLFEWLKKHPLYIQLHYLSCIIASHDEIPLLVYLPEPTYFKRLENLGLSLPSYELISSLSKKQTSLSSWGASSSLAKWALQNQLSYKTPDLHLVKTVNSKEFSYLFSPKLEGSSLISNESVLKEWWNSLEGPKVLKTLYGSSGRGHFISSGHSSELQKALLFFQKNKLSSPLLVAEPWVERVLDFSSQWEIHENGSYSYLGATLCKNSSKGIYHKSMAGPEEFLFKEHFSFLEQHLAFARKAVEKMASLSYFGNIGFDAMIYKHPKTQKEELLPIVEINARKTMGWVALKLYQKLKPQNLLSITYQSATENSQSLLPHFAICPQKQEKIYFPKQLILETNPVCF